MPVQSTSALQELADNVGPILDYEVVEHGSALVSFYEVQALKLDDPAYEPTLRTEQTGLLRLKLYRRGEGELTVQVPGGIGAPKIDPPQVEPITDEVLEFRGQDVVTTAHPVWIADAKGINPVVVAYASQFFSARTGAQLQVAQVSPGVFALPEAGFGVLTVSYPTRSQAVALEYEPLPAVLSAAQRKTLARSLVAMSGAVPESMLPMLYVRITYTMQRTDAEPVPLTVVAQDRMKINAFPVRWTGGSPVKPGEVDETEGGPNSPAVELRETSRQVRVERIKSSQNPANYVDVEVATAIELVDLRTKRPWRLILGK